MLRLGPHELRNPVVLAPMAGITDLPFRRLAWRFGAGLVVGEMTSANPATRDTWKSTARLAPVRDCGPVSLQIAGADPAWMADAARRAVAAGADVVDVNLGCPAKKVCRKAAGSALLREPETVRAIVAAVIAAVPVPVTVKMRTGWCPRSRNGVTIARMLEDLGIAALAVHGRTRACGYTGPVEYDTIARIRTATTLPLFANGDIRDGAGARRVLDHTGADGVLIGRAAQGRPWVPGRIAAELDGRPFREPRGAAVIRLLHEHVGAMHEHYGAPRGLRMARKHVGWTLDALEQPPWRRRGFNAIDDAAAQLRWLEALASEFEGAPEPASA